MARTLVNVVGNCLASAAVAKWEHDFGSEIDPAQPNPDVLEAVSD
jgi:proton glutamate symport protein